MVLSVCLAPHPILRRPARPVEAFTSRLEQFARDLVETMRAHDGVGLAAPQVGEGVQVVVANPIPPSGHGLWPWPPWVRCSEWVGGMSPHAGRLRGPPRRWSGWSSTGRRRADVVVVNPVLERLKGQAGIVEGCLSVPNVWGRVSRAARVRLRGQDLNGRPVVVDAEGLLAIILQHEMDHLQGRLFTDHFPKTAHSRQHIADSRQDRLAPCAVC